MRKEFFLLRTHIIGRGVGFLVIAAGIAIFGVWAELPMSVLLSGVFGVAAIVYFLEALRARPSVIVSDEGVLYPRFPPLRLGSRFVRWHEIKDVELFHGVGHDSSEIVLRHSDSAEFNFGIDLSWFADAGELYPTIREAWRRNAGNSSTPSVLNISYPRIYRLVPRLRFAYLGMSAFIIFFGVLMAEHPGAEKTAFVVGGVFLVLLGGFLIVRILTYHLTIGPDWVEKSTVLFSKRLSRGEIAGCLRETSSDDGFRRISLIPKDSGKSSISFTEQLEMDPSLWAWLNSLPHLTPSQARR
jgi:hypothetical protein